MKNKHTSTPWAIRRDYEIYGGRGLGRHVATTGREGGLQHIVDEDRANAELIVRAVNNIEKIEEAAWALVNQSGWRNYMPREVTGLMDDLVKALTQAQAEQL